MAQEEGERGSSGNPSDDHKQEDDEYTPRPRPQPRLRFVLGNSGTTTTIIHREDTENPNRIENREEEEEDNEEDEETAPAIAKKEEEEDNNNKADQPPAPPAASRQQYVCEHCGSEFSSGRALGGHKRIHGKNKKSGHREGSSYLDKNEKSDEYSCYICLMKFPSDKALHGHMRTHPDRPWRGMRPPSEQQSSPRHHRMMIRNNREDAIDDEVLKGALALVMISRGGVDMFSDSSYLNTKDQKIETSERRRISKKINLNDDKGKAKVVESERSDSDIDTDDDDYMEVDKYLKKKRQYLSLSLRVYCNLNKDQKIENITERMRILKKAKIVECECSDEDEYTKVEAKRPYYLNSRGLRIGQSYDHDQRQDGKFLPSPSTLRLKRYECTTCNKCFSSKQGLGGHMSSSSHKIKESANAKRSLIGNQDRHSGGGGSDIKNNVKSGQVNASLLMGLAYNQDGFEISNETMDEDSDTTRKNEQGFDLNELLSMKDDNGEEHS